MSKTPPPVVSALLADRFWRATGTERRHLGITFCEHGALAGGLLLLAWTDLGGHHG